jgi:isoleucyl-tRNA synthetase
MCCTFGDLTDVIWWRELDLPVRSVVGRDGRLLRETPEWLAADQGAAATYAEIAGKTTFSARTAVVDALRASGDLDGEPTPTERMANFYENGDKPLEIVTSRQWYIRNGGRDEELRATLVARGREITWVPDFMRHRYENWVNGLQGDWLISRQRFFGVAFPVWYRLDADGQPDYDDPILADEADLPVDPASLTPPGYTDDQRDVPGGFTADPDVMDTWATSLRRSCAAGSATPTSSSAPSRWTCARRPTRSSAPGCSRPWCAPTTSTASCRGRTRRSPASWSTPTARRCRSPRATWWCRPTCWSATARTPCAGGPPAPALAWTAPSTRPR